MALVLDSTQNLVLASVETHIQDAFSGGVEFPVATSLVKPIEGFNDPLMQKVQANGDTIATTTKGMFKSALMALVKALGIEQPIQSSLFHALPGTVVINYVKTTVPVPVSGTLTFIDGILVSST